MYSKSQIDRIVQTIVKEANPKKIILFGSYANGNPDEDSDLDIIVITDTKNKDLSLRIRKSIHYENIVAAMDLIILDEQRIKERYKINDLTFIDILENGEVLYAR